jgi:hypothetical protein
MDIEVVARADPGGRLIYFLVHDYDLDIFTGVPGPGPFPSRAEAMVAAGRLHEALSCVAD